MLRRGGPWANLVGVNCNWFSKKLLVLLPFVSCVTLSHTAAFVIARTNWNTWQGRVFWGKIFNNIDIHNHTHTHDKYTYTWAGRYTNRSVSECIRVYIEVSESRNNSEPQLHSSVGFATPSMVGELSWILFIFTTIYSLNQDHKTAHPLNSPLHTLPALSMEVPGYEKKMVRRSQEIKSRKNKG